MDHWWTIANEAWNCASPPPVPSLRTYIRIQMTLMSCVKDPRHPHLHLHPLYQPSSPPHTHTTHTPPAVNKQPSSSMSSAQSPGLSSSRVPSSVRIIPDLRGRVGSVRATTEVPGKDLNRFITESSCGPVRAAVCLQEEGGCRRERARGEGRESEGERERERSFPFSFRWFFFRHERRDLHFIQRYDIHGFVLRPLSGAEGSAGGPL